MKKVFMLMIFAVPILQSSCNSQSCCENKSTTNAAATSAASCKSCGKASCDKHCSANPGISDVKKALPSCTLDASAQLERGNGIIKQVFNQAKTINEMSNGWDLVFPRTPQLLAELEEIVAFERKCCASFNWEVVAAKKQIHLKISGSSAVKEELKSGFEQFGLAHLVSN